MRIEADRETCIGAGLCVLTADAVFDQDDGGVVLVLAEQVPDGEEQRVLDAVNLCPSGALQLLPQ